MTENKCKTCVHFERGSWHEEIDPDKSYQLGGYCTLLNEVLSMTNSHLWAMKHLYVQESFGCILHKMIPNEK